MTTNEPIDLVGLRKLVEEQPENGEAWLSYANLLFERDIEPAVAADAYWKAQVHLGLDCRLRIAHCLSNAGELDRAIRVAEEYLQEVGSETGYIVLADLLLEMGDLERTRRVLFEGVSKWPESGRLQIMMGEFLIRGTDPPLPLSVFSEAKSFFQRAVEIDPNSADANEALGWFLSRHTEGESGEEFLRAAVKLSPDDGWKAMKLANCLWRKGDEKGAENYYRLAVTLQPNISEFFKWFGDFLEASGFAE